MTTVSCNSTPVVLNEWFAAFGLGDDNRNIDDDKEEKHNDEDLQTADITDDTVYYQHFDAPSVASNNNSNKTNNNNAASFGAFCDPTKCRMLHGVCCDCCKCFDHCKCGDLNVLPPTCDTPDCSERVCPQCMRCHHHCLCRCSTVQREDDYQEYYSHRLSSSSAGSPTSVMKEQRASAVATVGTSIGRRRIAPPPFTEKVTSQHSVFENCYDPYEQGDDNETDGTITAYYYDDHDDWVGNNTRIVTSDGTVATTLTSSDRTLRQNKVNFEVVYDQNYTAAPRGASHTPPATTTVSSSSTREYFKMKQQQQQQQQQLRPPRSNRTRHSWNYCTRPKGAAALAEF